MMHVQPVRPFRGAEKTPCWNLTRECAF